MTRTARRRPRVVTMAGVVLALVLLAAGCINTGTWSAAPAPVAPVQGLTTSMTDVSCVTQDWCLAVGSLGFYPLAEVWDGSTWSVVSAPSLAHADNTDPGSVACGTPTSCVAKVGRSFPSADLYDYAVAWDGEQWHEVAGGSEGAYVDTIPYGCASDGTCLIVDNGWGQETVVWDGHAATRIPFTTTRPPWETTAIDCLAADTCLASTSYSTALWNGTTWSELPGSDYAHIFSSGPTTFSCSAIDRCLAVGPDPLEAELTSATWDGSSWTEVAFPEGLTNAGTLECVSATQCLLRVPGGMLAWIGSAWVSAPPAPAGSRGMSCLDQRCLVVGAIGSPASPTAATYEWTNP